MIKKQCAVCDSTDCRPFPNKFFKNLLLRCHQCGLIFVQPQPDLTELKKIYGANYFKNADSNAIGYEDYLGDKINIIKTFERRIKKIEKLYPAKGRILDLGCALGFFLETAAKRGWEPYGLEISDYAANMAKQQFGDNVCQGALDITCFSNDNFDIITMWDYLEHIADPSQELTRAWQLLKKGGILILSAPDAGSWPHKIFGPKWMGYKDQEHLYYFSKKNLETLLTKTGFQILKSQKIGKYVSLSLFIKRLGLYNASLANIFKLISKNKKIANLSFYVNPLDITCFYAKK